MTKEYRQKKWYEQNKERILEKQKKYQKENRDLYNRARKIRYDKNPEKYRKQSQNFRLRNPEKIKKYNRRKTERGYTKQYNLKLRLKLFDILGKECVLCGYNKDLDCLQFDHINGNVKQTMKYMSLSLMYNYYLQNIEETKKILQVLCINCNWLKGLEERNNIKRSLKNTKKAIYDRVKGKEYRIRLRKKLFQILGYKHCKICNEKNELLLHFDHINNGGKQERISRNYHTDSFYKNNPELAKKNLQILCAMCNWKKERIRIAQKVVVTTV